MEPRPVEPGTFPLAYVSVSSNGSIGVEQLVAPLLCLARFAFQYPLTDRLGWNLYTVYRAWRTIGVSVSSNGSIGVELQLGDI